MKYKVLSNQSLLDVSLQTTGSIEGAFALAELNGLSITDNVVGATLSTKGLTVLTPQVVAYYKTNTIIPATDGDRHRVFDDSFDLTFY